MRTLSLLLALLVGLTAAPACAESAQERARAAVEAGEIRSLQDILERVRRQFDGRVLDAELDESGRDRWVYQIKILTGDGEVLALAVDARTAEVLRVKGRRN
jgi:uncharacterized membrane protein YkoI